jgi:hypothetical protein
VIGNAAWLTGLTLAIYPLLATKMRERLIA